ncbi:integrase [Pseudomonas lini]|uniref:tyrosine-type recombinase/integrase n=1 Tax=Pseudomonas lini TaxID=163011 RepID=UPI0027851C64|nr:tyrosine-type recombinase/integrase [Pseudomonas lini]MDQ0121552.1 integrase [Pseudomonas lini]
MADNLIQKKGESTWYVRLAVPADVQHKLGAKVLIQSLKTGLRKEAMVRRLPVLAEWKALIQTVRDKRANRGDEWKGEVATRIEQYTGQFRELKRDVAVDDPNPAGYGILTELINNPEFANSWRQGFYNHIGPERQIELERLKGLPQDDHATKMAWHAFQQRTFFEDLSKVHTDKYDLAPGEVETMGEIVAAPKSHKSSSPITTARLKTYREFRESRGGAPKHVDQQVGKMERLSEFLKKESLPLNFDTVDAWLKSLDRAPATLGQYLMAGTAFWKWATKYDAALREEYKDKVNPFVGHELPQGGGSELAGQSREMYTRDDTLKLRQAALDNEDKPLADLITLGWYTGARIEELCRLNKESVITVDGIRCFSFPKSKNPSSKRVLPIHPSLLPAIDRLLEDTTDTFLIPTSSHDHYGKRSHAISKAFGRLRTAAGFSRLHVFHSFRNTVITGLVRAEVPDPLAKELVGHREGTVTHDVYSKGASTAQKLAAISKLPALPA